MGALLSTDWLMLDIMNRECLPEPPLVIQVFSPYNLCISNYAIDFSDTS